MKTFTILSTFTALAAAAPFPTGFSGPLAPSGTAPPYPYRPGTGFSSPTGAFPSGLNNTQRHHHHHHHPSGYIHHTGTAPASLSTGTAPYKREAQFGDRSRPSHPSFNIPSLPLPTGTSLPAPSGNSKASSSQFSFPAAALDSIAGSPFPTADFGSTSIPSPGSEPGIPFAISDSSSKSGAGLNFPTGGFGSGFGSSSPTSFSLPTSAPSGGGSAATTPTTPTTVLSEFEIARRKSQFEGRSSFSFFPLSKVRLGDGIVASTGFTASASCPSGIVSTGVAFPTGGALK